MSDRSHQAGGWSLTIRLILIGTSVFALYANAFSVLAPTYNRMVHWGLLATVVFLIYRRDRSTQGNPSMTDIALAVLMVAASVFVIVDGSLLH